MAEPADRRIAYGRALLTPWNARKTRPSVLDVERLLRQHRLGIQRCLAAWLEKGEKAGSGADRQLAM